MIADSHWIPAKFPPDNSRRVTVRMPGGSVTTAFYWRAEGAWYAHPENKRPADQIYPAAWSEICEFKETP